MAFRAAVRILLASALVSGAFPVLAGTADTGSLEARVDRLLWQLVNDARYSHLQVAANYERLRAQLLEQACLVSAAPCAQPDKLTHKGATMTTEITPEQVEIIEKLMFTLHSASVSVAAPPAHLLVTSAE
jgi:hypothetical protein